MLKSPSIRNSIKCIYIVCHNENTEQLESSLSKEGLSVSISRQRDTPKNISPSILCLQNHLKIWETTVENNINTIVVEADFVPIKGFGSQPLPIPSDQLDHSFAYLYTCGIEVYDIVEKDYLRGHSGSTVAYYLNPKSAKSLINFASQILTNNAPSQYSIWDTSLRYFLQKNGINSFVPFRNLGEHGGQPNYEHNKKGLNGTHRADRLAANLHYLPDYANGSKTTYYKVRFMAWFWGVGRLFTGRTTTKDSVRRQKPAIIFLIKLLRRHTL